VSWHSIALVGIDGSGKSTQARLLCQRLEAQDKRVLLIHPFGRKLLAFLPSGRQGTGASGSPSRGGRPALRRLAAVVELLDIAVYVWVAYVRSRAMALSGTSDAWLVSDRSFDDLLIKHRRLHTLPESGLAWARRLVPMAETTVWLNTEPRVAMQRDHDFGSEYYEELHQDYDAAARRYGWRIVPTSERSVDEISADVDAVVG
jgi:thymidylate kinase